MKAKYQPGRDGPVSCPHCTRVMPNHSEYGCVFQPSATIEGWTCRTYEDRRQATYGHSASLIWMIDGRLIVRTGGDVEIPQKVLTWLLVFRGCPETMHSYESKWVSTDNGRW